MAPVDLEPSTSVVPALTRGSHILLAAGLTAIAGRSIFRSYLTLPPSSTTRHREPLRRGHVKLFSALALLSGVTAMYYGSTFAWLSYQVWAGERGIELPNSFFGDNGAFRGGEHPGRFQLVRWLNDTPLYKDAFEIVAGKARYFWWGQQASLSTLSWSTFLAIEGKRRKISNLWAFLLLGQLVSLSYGQNLFFVATLLTPVPLPDNVTSLTRSSVPATSSRFARLKSKILLAKPDGWLPHPAFYIMPLLVSLGAVVLTPYSVNSPFFMNIALLFQALPSINILLPYLIPESWGTTHTHPHSAQKTYTTLFRTISSLSALLHLKSTGMALFYSTPSSEYYHPTLLHPLNHEHRSTLDRSSAAIAKLFGAIGEHPAVSAVGYDVLLSGVSIGLWTAIRSLDPTDLLSSSIPFVGGNTASSLVEEAKHEPEEESTMVETSPKKRTRGRPKKAEPLATSNEVRVPKTRRRKQAEPDSAYQPTADESRIEGDEEAMEDDWEAAALAWGLISAGGLGLGSCGVFGAECVAR
ncbi:hypothetical protein BP5796_06276 [Coleophoma crateriformis]|uniref:Uncharacterized protein n=1 Tax=Coleophoma crateriformis TaxID=565419 RepID=A0A3D8RX63_9HELO|nr:hypothetical protein BP5796_06276 [Coleophoma crateriformis]